MEPCDTSCEPMDVDLSINSVTDTPNKSVSNLQDCEEIDVKPDKWHFKTYHIKKKPEKKIKPIYKTLLALLTVCGAVCVYHILTFRCTEELDLEDLRTKLETSLHDQTDAINNLLYGLGMDTESKILLLYGGTGVGKTFTTSLLLENVWNSSNVYHYTMPSFVDVFSIDNMFGLSICKTSIVVVDDLKPTDLVLIKKLIKKIVNKSENLSKNITVILVCNCDIISKDLVKKCDNDFLLFLEKIFNDLDLYKKFIKYQPLTQNTLEKCIQDEIGSWNVSKKDLNNLLNNFNVSLDGCKGVHKKIKFLNLI